MKVLVAEDEVKLAADLRENLEEAGFLVEVCHDGNSAWFLGDTEPVDAVILDLGLPRLDGLSVLKKWRSGGCKVPVLILTAQGKWTERVQGIDAGADDYLVKPFRMEELLARLHAILRRSNGHSVSQLECGRLAIDTRQAKVTVDGKLVNFTALEYRALQYLLVHEPRIVSQHELIEHVYGSDELRDANALEALVRRVRKKLMINFIRNKRGIGYYIADED